MGGSQVGRAGALGGTVSDRAAEGGRGLLACALERTLGFWGCTSSASAIGSGKASAVLGASSRGCMTGKALGTPCSNGAGDAAGIVDAMRKDPNKWLRNNPTNANATSAVVTAVTRSQRAPTRRGGFAFTVTAVASSIFGSDSQPMAWLTGVAVDIPSCSCLMRCRVWLSVCESVASRLAHLRWSHSAIVDGLATLMDASISSANARALAKRRSGARSNARSTRSSSILGTSGLTALGGRTGWFKTR